MSVEHVDDQETDQSGNLPAVGQRLATERRQQQREVAAVANALHLRPEVVEALEAGDEQKLPATAFVRGYVKSYARLLGLSENELVALMPVAEVSRPVPLKRVGMRRRSVSLPIGKWLLWIVGLMLVAALLVYGVPLVERLLNKGEQPVASDALPLPLDGGDTAATEPVLELPPQDMAPDVGVAADQAVEQQEPEAVDIAEPAVEKKVELERVPEPEQMPAPVVESAPTAGPATITLQFSQDSWVEMESNGRKLVVGTQAAGSERTVRAEPPVSILLGNAPGVVIIYRGERVDLKPYQRGKVARLVLED